MRRLAYVLILVFAVSVSGAPRDTRDRVNPIVKTFKSLIRVLGDGLTIPSPAKP
ncbi:MAG TPA: hypothetical protein VGF69_13155 [Thermoanaerobaculia bacterium]|jgi:hypothetical protein